jgi:cysteine desulfurase
VDRLVYLDHAATCPTDPDVVAAMHPFYAEVFGNPSSLHLAGRRARAAVDEARGEVAALIGAEPESLVFTASGTESVNLALRGVMERDGRADGHIVVSAIEHPAVLETCRYLERAGARVTRLAVGADGLVDADDLADAIRADTRLVSVMAANNVVGTVQPVGALAQVAHEHGVLFHTDAVQAVGKIPLDVERDGVDLLSMSAHKLYGPKGVGGLFVRSGIELQPIVYGGGQERGFRSATENVPGVVGFGHAALMARLGLGAEAARLVALRDHILDAVLAAIPEAYLVGDRYRRLPGHVCLGFAGHEGEAIKILLDLDAQGIAVSSGSACSAHHAGEPSHVLQAMGFDPIQARGSLRVSLGRFNTTEDARRFVAAITTTLASLRPPRAPAS